MAFSFPDAMTEGGKFTPLSQTKIPTDYLLVFDKKIGTQNWKNPQSTFAKNWETRPKISFDFCRFLSDLAKLREFILEILSDNFLFSLFFPLSFLLFSFLSFLLFSLFFFCIRAPPAPKICQLKGGSTEVRRELRKNGAAWCLAWCPWGEATAEAACFHEPFAFPIATRTIFCDKSISWSP